MNPLLSPNANLLLLLLFVWTIPWKLYAVWIAATRRQRGWFIALVILNTVSILELIYIFYVAKKTMADIREDLSAVFPSKK